MQASSPAITAPIGASPRTRELAPRELLDFASIAVGNARQSATAVGLLVLNLRRSDRLDALMGAPDSEGLFARVLDTLELLVLPHDRFAPASHEEIWLVLPDLADASLAVLAAIRIVRKLEGQGFSSDPDLQLRPCIGIAYCPDHTNDVIRLVHMADAACKLAALREESYCVYQASDRVSIVQDPELESIVREAVRTNALEVHYQPQIDLKTGRCRSAEALVRWPVSDARVVPAAIIAEVAENTEINHPFTLFILNTVLRHMVGFRRVGVDARMSVNISPTLLNDGELPEILAQSFDAWSVPPDQLTVEVTEGTIVKDVRRSAQVLDRVRQLGVRLAMDDFGTGYSSLAQFKRLPFDEIKIDKLFVQNMLQSKGDTQIVRSMVDLAHNFGLVTVAEGVEDLATLDRLRELGCDFAQGYAISKALPEPAFRNWWLELHSIAG